MYSSNVLDGVAKEAISFVLDNYVQLLKMAALLSVVESLIWWLSPAGTIFETVQGLTTTLLYALFAIAIHRWIILGTLKFPPTIDVRVAYFIGIFIVETLGIVFLPLGAELFGTGIFTGSGIIALAFMFVGVVYAVWIGSRLLTVYPHIAVTRLDTMRIASGWELSREPVWEIAKRLVFFFVCSVIPVLVFAMVMPQEAGGGVDSISERTVWAPVTFFVMMIGYAPIPFFVALASFIYRRLVDDLQEQQEAT